MKSSTEKMDRVITDLAGCAIDKYEVEIYDDLLPLTKFGILSQSSPEFQENLMKRMAPFLDKMKEGQDRCEGSGSREPEIKPVNSTPISHEIKNRAKEVGCELCGFTTLEPPWVFSDGKAKVFHHNAVVLVMEMDYSAIDQAPGEAAGQETMRTYAELGLVAAKIADFILSKGYHAQAHHPMGGNILPLPHAIKAGLGQLGANGNLCTKEFGPRLRLAMVTTDAPLIFDQPKDLKIDELCEACHICIDSCPGKALSPFKVHWRGTTKWKNNWQKCFPIFQKYGGCSICIKVCPLHKNGYKATMETYLGLGQLS